jgi:hypothetical protein
MGQSGQERSNPSVKKMSDGICPTCTRWFCTDRHDLDGLSAKERNRAKVARWQKENREKANAKARRYYARKREKQNGVLQ